MAGPGPLHRARARLGRIRADWRGWRGHVDGVIDDALVGWVMATEPNAGPQQVGVYTARGLVAQATANLQRDDLRAAGLGNGRNGFAIPLDTTTRKAIADGGNSVRVRILGPHGGEIGRWHFGAGNGARHGTRQSHLSPAEALQQLVYGALAKLDDLTAEQRTHGAEMAAADAPPLNRHGLLFSDRDLLAGGALPPALTAYGDYVRYRYRLDAEFDISPPESRSAEGVHFLQWYLAGYSPLRRGLRVPLSAEQIAYLNAPVLLGGQRFSFSRATWMFLPDVHPITASMNFANADWVDWAVYWWAIDQAKALNVEDCLVPQSYRARLGGISEEHEGKPWAPTMFMRRMHAETPALATLNLDREDDRQRLLSILMLLAVQRPDYLRYIPAPDVDAMLASDGDNPGPFARFLAEMKQAAPSAEGTVSGLAGGATAPFSRRDYHALLLNQGFDLDRGEFCFLTGQGDRFEAARLSPPSGEKVDVQVIGPFEKASGLGQAVRLSVQALEHAGVTLNCVDFDLDNPAPEGYSHVGKLNGYRPARVNLIHLNAESIPLAFAYQPDVFSGAWNIGYFFWELDTPAACHYLALGLLDEVWVSTRYGVDIYRPHGDLPVTNVGMCFEAPPEISRSAARAFLRERCGTREGEFVFLVAFDSFSFVQRKNPVGTIRAFLRAFAGDPGVRLLVKTQNRTKVRDPAQVKIWQEIDTLIAGDSRISIIDETFPYDDLLKMKKGADAYVSLHRSEGWGFGMIEAMGLGVPVVATAYSGNMEFCSDQTAFLVDYTEVELQQGDYIFVREGQKWAEPDIDSAARQLKAVRNDTALRESRVAAALANVRENFSSEAIGRRYATRLAEILEARQ